ncbi:chromosomal segregation/condensation protein [Mesoplasma florum L1]|uniref:Segregation and condensation protein A n=1 Tax=Mesoplasma florum (strain ATCC 33453 / NBRC 100688 / NCTC 11704 / L1) TaxID=265311 RepID=Q6F0R5_MESFL|nr:segregation/condensation protein A [Mesoplasma florum]AAT75908.1 chromosomal segregation/condensation protein [Mesoplasma florum L1]ATI73515.1 chromosome segregation protein ScpA [Mesoplasma florum]ATI74203.1 chromosome segregation protein ScpA [Mesoplasma florum]AVN61213.1 chromosome segregation protein ScpA [Mesoplasma florum]AVN61908.1 chromosome segregation protein ScpA [Mesoplasma florum]
MQHWDELNISNFSGPLDLLWNMVKDKKIDIFEINLSEIIDQYLKYIEGQQKLDIELASEYLVLAAQMIEMKSRILLPNDDDDSEEELMFEDLLEQINQYGQIKEVSEYFYNKQEEYLKTFSKPKTKKSFIQSIADRNDELMVNPLDIGIDEFAEIFQSILQRAQNFDEDFEYDENMLLEDAYAPIQNEIISPQVIARSIVDVMKTNKHKEWRLEEVITGYELNLINLISTFLAVLDMVRHQVAVINQKNDTLEFRFTSEALADESVLRRIEEVEEYE